MRRLLWGLLTILATIVPSAISQAQEAQDAQEPEETIVREIDVRFSGPETVNRAVVMANIQTAVGKPRTREMIEQDVRNLINTGYFYDVRVLDQVFLDRLGLAMDLVPVPDDRERSAQLPAQFVQELHHLLGVERLVDRQQTEVQADPGAGGHEKPFDK